VRYGVFLPIEAENRPRDGLFGPYFELFLHWILLCAALVCFFRIVMRGSRGV